MIQLTLTLKMTTAQVVETSVTVNNNSPIEDYVHLDDQTQPPFNICESWRTNWGRVSIDYLLSERVFWLTQGFIARNRVIRNLWWTTSYNWLYFVNPSPALVPFFTLQIELPNWFTHWCDYRPNCTGSFCDYKSDILDPIGDINFFVAYLSCTK